MHQQFGAVLIFILLGGLFVFGSMIVGSLVRLKKHETDKHSIYECGEPTIGSSWIRYNSRFYNVALVYLLFDVEVVLLIPAALVLRERAQEGLGYGPLAALSAFLLLLALGLAYEWFYGNLDWIRKGKELECEKPEAGGGARPTS